MRLIFSEAKCGYEERERSGIEAAHTKFLRPLPAITSADRILRERAKD
jgi:hypothetical protein